VTVDRTSWGHVAGRGDLADVERFLREEPLHGVDLTQVAWRCRDAAGFRAVVGALRDRGAYSAELWAYALLHPGEDGALGEWLRCHALSRAVGPWLSGAPLVGELADPGYEHLEYAPLVNARAHLLGKRRRVLNGVLEQQYRRFLERLCHKDAGPDDADRAALAYYLFLQDRVGEALDAFERVDRAACGMPMQYDYLSCHALLYLERPGEARELARPWAERCGVLRWRARFAAVLEQTEGAAGGAGAAGADAGAGAAGADAGAGEGEAGRAAQMSALAAGEPSLEMELEGAEVVVTSARLGAFEVRFYLMDTELLFSTQPFLRGEGGGERFGYVSPNAVVRVDGAAAGGAAGVSRVRVPEALASSNLFVEAVGLGEGAGASLRRSRVRFSNSLAVDVAAAYGVVTVRDRATGRGVPKTYVKAYARTPGGGHRFHKDGYTDLRGMFDYASLSTEAGGVDRFAVLVSSDTHGVWIGECDAPSA